MRLRAAALILSCDIVPSISGLVPAPGHRTEEVTMERNHPREDCAALILGHYHQRRAGVARIRQTWLPTVRIRQPGKRKVRRWVPSRRDCCQYCCQAGRQPPSRDDKPGISAQKMPTPGQSWTVCPCLRIRCSRRAVLSPGALWSGHAWAISRERSRQPAVTLEHSTPVGQQEHSS